MGFATILGALIGGGGAIFSQLITSEDMDAANNEARTWQTPKDVTLFVCRDRDRLANMTLRQRKREARMQQQESRANRTQRKKEFAAGQQTEFFNRQMGFINANEQLRNNFANLFKRGRA